MGIIVPSGLTSPLTTKGDIWTYGTANSRIAVGTNNQVLTADSAEATGIKWAAAGGGLSTKAITSTRDMTAATGSVAYTGAGVTPTAVFAWGSVAGQAAAVSWAFADSAKTSYRIEREGASFFYGGTGIFYIVTSTGNNQTAIISTYDSDGITISWTKGGTPTGTADIFFLFMK